MTDLQRHCEFLRVLGAPKVPHSGRTLYDHLMGTREVLKSWDQPCETCVAGMFHSVYGTREPRNRIVKERWQLIDEIGDDAERLVFLFSKLRKRSFVRFHAGDIDRRPTYFVAGMVLTAETTNSLVHLLLSNTYENATNTLAPQESRERHSVKCQKTAEALSSYFSPSVRADVQSLTFGSASPRRFGRYAPNPIRIMHAVLRRALGQALSAGLKTSTTRRGTRSRNG